MLVSFTREAYVAKGRKTSIKQTKKDYFLFLLLFRRFVDTVDERVRNCIGADDGVEDVEEGLVPLLVIVVGVKHAQNLVRRPECHIRHQDKSGLTHNLLKMSHCNLYRVSYLASFLNCNHGRADPFGRRRLSRDMNMAGNTLEHLYFLNILLLLHLYSPLLLLLYLFLLVNHYGLQWYHLQVIRR